jgi:glutamine amidotransferase
MKIHIVDYGMGNIFSVQKKLLEENITVSISSKPQDILQADKIILLGVGNFKRAMDNLQELNLIEPLENFAYSKKAHTWNLPRNAINGYF